MNWIKKNPAMLSLAIAALILLAVAFTLYSNAIGFSDGFQGGNSSPSEDSKIPPTDIKLVDAGVSAMEKPATWTVTKGSPFVSVKYLVKDGRLINPRDSLIPLHAPVPNSFIKEPLDITSASMLTDDYDQDGFDLLLEYSGMDGVITTKLPEIESDSTDPTNAESHPPYETRLFLVKIHQVPFRLLFRAYDHNARTGATNIQINPLDKGGKTVFVDVGQQVPGTDWKFESFVLKEGDKDESIANMVNVKNGQKLSLMNNVMGNSPESFAIFRYLWVAVGGTPTKDFAKRKDETFTLDPQPDKTFKVLEIRKEEVEVLLPSGQKKVFKLTPNPPK
jgi:hypothetical protein